MTNDPISASQGVEGRPPAVAADDLDGKEWMMALDVKRPKGYRKAFDGDQGTEGLRDQQRPIGWCRDERIRRGMDEVIQQTEDYTLVHVLGTHSPDNIHGGQWILWDGHGRCYAIGPEKWTRKKLDELLAGANGSH